MRYFTSLSLLLSLLLITSAGCEQIDDLAGGGIDKPTVSYSSTTFDATFFEAGSSSAPSLDWNGEQGSVSLGSSITGLSVNSTTGKLEWTKLLPPGTHEAEVVVSNSEGQVVVPVTINNPLSGDFDGTYAGSNDFRFEIFADGSMLLYADGTQATGTWAINDDGDFTGYYVYDDYPDVDYTLLADIDQTNARVTLVGDYYDGVYSAGDSPINEFEVTLQ